MLINNSSREIKFRAIKVADNKVIYGSAISDQVFCYPQESGCSWLFNPNDINHTLGWNKVYTNSINQYINFKDNKSVEIYENDKVKCNWWLDYSGNDVIGTVKIVDACATVEFDEPQFDRISGILRLRHYVKCFIVNHAIEVISTPTTQGATNAQ